MTTKHTYSISSRTGGAYLGDWQGVDEADAIEAMHRDAGYESTAHAAAELHTTADALRADVTVKRIDTNANN